MDKWKNECLTFLAPSLLLRTVLQPFDSRESTRYSETRHLWPELIGPEENTWPKPGQKSPSLGILSSGYWGSLVSLCCRSHKIQNLDSYSFLIFYMLERECNWYTKTKRDKKRPPLSQRLVPKLHWPSCTCFLLQTACPILPLNEVPQHLSNRAPFSWLKDIRIKKIIN